MRPIFGAALFVTALLGTPAEADDDLIVVTATRAPTSAGDVSGRIETIDREEIEAQSLATLAEAIGAEAVQAGGPGQQTSVFLRGANSKHVLALLDGIRLNDASTPNAQYDFGADLLGAVQRVEVLRGPASAVHGSDAIGGVVNVIPRRGGSGVFEPIWEAAVGSFDTRRALLGAAGTAAALDYGLAAEWFATEGHDLIPQRMSTHTGNADGSEIAVLTASIRDQVGPILVDALLRIREATAEFDTFSGGQGFDLRADDPDLENESEQLVWRLGAETSGPHGATVRLSGGQVMADRSEADGGLETSSAQSERSFVEAIAQRSLGAGRITAGFSFARDEIDSRPQFAAPLVAGEDQYAGFVVAQVDLAQRVAATAAARVDDYENYGAHSTISLGAVVNIAPLRLFASFGEAFKGPSLTERFETSLFNIGNPDLEAETSRSWELGADFSVNERVRLGGSYYRTRISGLIEYDFAALQNVNIGRAEIEGVDFYADARLTDWISFRVDYSRTDARNDDTGARLARRPEHAWSIQGELAPTERLGLVASWSHVGDRVDVAYDDAGQFASAAGAAEEFGVGSLAATYVLTSGVQAFARVDNVTDEIYEQPLAFAGRPRSVAVGLRARR